MSIPRRRARVKANSVVTTSAMGLYPTINAESHHNYQITEKPLAQSLGLTPISFARPIRRSIKTTHATMIFTHGLPNASFGFGTAKAFAGSVHLVHIGTHPR